VADYTIAVARIDSLGAERGPPLKLRHSDKHRRLCL